MSRGAAAFELEGRRHIAPPGSVFIVAPDLVHTGEPAMPEGYSYEVLYLEPDVLAEVAEALGARSPRLPRQVVLSDAQLASELADLHTSLRHNTDPLATEERYAIAVEGICRKLKPTPEQSTERPHRSSIDRALELLRERWSEPVALSELAAAASPSPSALVRRFRREVGMPPHAFQLNLRILHARELLRRGMTPVQVAAATGFYDQAHLTRVFKRVVGVPPRRFANA